MINNKINSKSANRGRYTSRWKLSSVVRLMPVNSLIVHAASWVTAAKETAKGTAERDDEKAEVTVREVKLRFSHSRLTTYTQPTYHLHTYEHL